jgi:hypothetical protein
MIMLIDYKFIIYYIRFNLFRLLLPLGQKATQCSTHCFSLNSVAFLFQNHHQYLLLI